MDNRLLQTTVNGATATYTYNYRGQTTLYFYGPNAHLIAEVDAATGQTIRAYVWLEDRPLAYITGGQVYYVHADHLGTPLALTDDTGAVVWRARYTPFGQATITGSVTFNLRLPGQYFDAETGLHYNWHRYYDPAIGRYITSDPVWLAGGLDL